MQVTYSTLIIIRPEIKEAKLTIHELFTTGESSYFGTVPFGPLKIVF